MKLSREAILDKTHYGIKIYAFVLRQYLPKNVLYLSGNTCRPTNNPFNHNRPTLVIRIENGIAVHSDLERPNFSGDAFSFANKFYKLATNEELYHLLNQTMHLDLKVEAENNLAWLNLEDDSWNPRVSLFKAPVRNVFPLGTRSLAEVQNLITGNAYRKVTEELRKITDPKQKRIFKANNFDYVTFSGVFTARNDKSLVKHSQLLIIDFDHLPNLPEVWNLLLEDPYFETHMLFRSPSNDGLKWLIKKDSEKIPHAVFFKAVANYLNRTYHLEVDQSGRDVSRACFLPFAEDCYLNPKHKLLG